MIHHSKQHCEFLRQQAKNKFDKVRGTWCDLLRWALPHKSTWITSQTPGERKNHHIVDPTHTLALRSFVAGFLEGNTSASRPWYRIGTRDTDRNDNDENKKWLQHFTQRTLSALGTSNFYHAAGNFYYDYGVVNTGTHYMEELSNGFHVHTLIPGSYYVINDAYGEAQILVREFSLNVKSIVDSYAKLDSNGKADWSNISHNVKKMYQDGNYSQMVDIVHIIMENSNFDNDNPHDPNNRKWLEKTYELGGVGGHHFLDGMEFGTGDSGKNNDVFLKEFTGKRKPFIVGKSSNEFEYGEKGPTIDALGLIKSLNKKAISKDQAIEQILKPALQGPSSLRKSYISHAPNTFVPLDARAGRNNQKLEPIFQVNPAIGTLIQDVSDMRQQVDKLYYADFLLFLSKNPKTRTATEASAVIEEQQRIIGPNLQSLNSTYNVPVLEWVMDYVLFEDEFLEPAPEALRGQSLKPEFISVFAQAQKAAD
ncbi:MAG: hypothetical protein KAQ85_08090, partial [Thermodesulfovibrionia bacterium]|nr:hypothetical protein [Thermodesulfovibrionia bacterium]